MFEFLKNIGGDETDSASSAADTGIIPTAGVKLENSASAETLRGATAGNGKRSEPKSGTVAPKGTDDFALAQQIKALDDLLDPKVWKSAMGAPGDAMVVITGKDYWEISSDEKEALAKTGAATARYFMATDPKWLALSLFSFSLLSVYGSRAMKHVMDKKQEKKNAMPANATNA